MKEGRSSRWKRLLSLVMACVMTLTLCLPATASAKETKPAKKEITEVELAIGDVSRLEVLGWYEKTIWSTDNEAVAPVTEDGTVTAAAEGTAVVSAESHLFRGRLKVRTNFTVTVGPAREGVRIIAGETAQLTEAGRVQWTSADPETAAVAQDGTVTGVREGETTVTATVTASKFPRILRWGNMAVTTTKTYEIAVVNLYTVTFASNGGSQVEPQTVETGMQATEPEAPVKDGFAFAGWYTDEALTQAYDFETPVTADLTLYAKWTEPAQDTFTVTFVSNGGSAVDSQQVERGATVAIPADPTREGYRLVAWYENEELTSVYDFDTPVSADLTLYARWEELHGEESSYLDQVAPENEIYSFTTDTWSVPVGKQTMVTFTAEIFEEFALKAEAVSVVAGDGSVLGYMHDDGQNGDAAGDDGIYTLQVNLSADKRQLVQYTAVVGELVSAPVSIVFHQDYTAAERTDYDAVVAAVQAAAAPYLDASGLLIEEKQQEAAKALEDCLKGLTTVKEYLTSGDQTEICLTSGMQFTFVWQRAGMEAGIGAGKIATFQPHKGQWDVESLNAAADQMTDGSAQQVEDAVPGYAFATNADLQDVSVDAMKQLADYRIVIINTHGVYSPAFGSLISLGQEPTAALDAQYSEDLQAHRLCKVVTGGKETYAISGGFIQRYVGQMDQSLIYLGACASVQDWYDDKPQTYELTRALLDKGAAAVVGFTDAVHAQYDYQIGTALFDALTAQTNGVYTSLSDALASAKEQCGTKDTAPGAECRIVATSDAAAASWRLADATMGTLQGVVQSAETDEPVANALIRAYTMDGQELPYQTRTDAQGQYTMELPAGEQILQVSTGDCKSVRTSVDVTADDLTYVESTAVVRAPANRNSTGAVRGYVVNSVTNVNLQEVTIYLRRGWGNTDGQVISVNGQKSFETDQEGYYFISGLEEGYYTMECHRSGFATEYKYVSVYPGSDRRNVRLFLTPVGSEGVFRIVLQWGATPRDLDSHMEGKTNTGGDFHVCYWEKNYYEGDKHVVSLDVDDTSSYGPETITLDPSNKEPYYYYVHNFSGDGSLAGCGAKVSVYYGTNCFRVFNAPVYGEGEYWNVCAIQDGKTYGRDTIDTQPNTTYMNQANDTPAKTLYFSYEDSHKQGVNTSFEFGAYPFRNAPENYNKDLAVMGAVLSKAIEESHHNRNYDANDNSMGIGKVYEAMHINGNDRLIEREEYTGGNFLDQGVRFCRSVAHKDMIINGQKTAVLFVTCSGTSVHMDWGDVDVNEAFLDHFTKKATGLYPFDGYEVYIGIHEFYEKVNESILKYYEGHKEAFKKPMKVFISGHSLGGAAANLVAAQFKIAKPEWAKNVNSTDVYAYTYGSIDSINVDRSVTSEYEYIHNIYNWYDTFGPNSDIWDLTTAAGKTGHGRFGHLDYFKHDYCNREENESATNPVNHYMEYYIRAINDDLPKCDHSRNQLP